MDENLENPSRSERVRELLKQSLVYLKQIVLSAVGVAALVGVSFYFTKGYTVKAYSDRLFIVGVMITLGGVFVFITMAGTRRRMGLPTLAKNKEEARKIMDRSDELRDKTEKRYDAGSQIWVIGTACMVLSVLLFYVLSILKL